MDDEPVSFDRSVEALIFKVGYYPIHHGGVGIIRSLGCAGVPVTCICEDRFTPAALSRYLKRAVIWPSQEMIEKNRIIERLLDLEREGCAKSVIIPTDDRAALILAENQEALRGKFLLPFQPKDLLGRLFNKRSLLELSARFGIAQPVSIVPNNWSEISDFAQNVGYPIVIKVAERQVFSSGKWGVSTLLVKSEAELEKITSVEEIISPRQLIAQEYLTPHESEHWLFSGCCDNEGNLLVGFSGRKLYSFPLNAGQTALGVARDNSSLFEIVAALCKSIRYAGVFGLDIKLDLRDKNYKLLDFNPRVPNNFLLFKNDQGIDIVRALHLYLTGRSIPTGRIMDERYLMVDNFLLPISWPYLLTLIGKSLTRNNTELVSAWFDGSDPLPWLGMWIRMPFERN